MFVTFVWGCSIGDIDTIDEDLVPGEEVKEISFNVAERVLMLFVILIGFWWLSALAEMAHWMSSSVASYYYYRKTHGALTESLVTMLRYHFGSILLGSIINPILRMPRVLVSGIKGKVRLADPAFSNVCVYACCPVCYCHNHIFKFATDNTASYQALWGTPYCTSSKKGYHIAKNSKVEARKMMSAGDFAVWIV